MTLIAHIREKLTVRVILGLIAASLVLGTIAWSIARNADDTPNAPETQIRTVETATVQALAGGATPLTTVGEVRSRSEAELRAKRAGTLTSVSYSAGDTVPAGAVVAAIENDAERASVAQARARISAAEAGLLRAQTGARPERLAVLEASITSTENTLQTAQVDARDVVISAYSAMVSAIFHGTDVMFENPQGPVPTFEPVTVEYVARITAENERVFMEALITQAETRAARTGPVTKAELTEVEKDLRMVLSFIDTILIALNGSVPNSEFPQSALDTFTATAQSARSTISGTIATVTSARNAIANAELALAASKRQYEEGAADPLPVDIATAQAGVEEAQAGLSAAFASLENTYIRSPISGTLTTWAPTQGAFVTTQELLGIVANRGALEALAYVSPEDSKRIMVGSAAVVADTFAGTVTSVAPGIDPSRGLVEIRIGISDSADLTHGETVSLSISRTLAPSQGQSATLLPLTAVKLTANGALIFTVSSENTAVAIPVTVGEVIGRSIEITHGITPTTEIIVDARGLTEGALLEVAR